MLKKHITFELGEINRIHIRRKESNVIGATENVIRVNNACLALCDLILCESNEFNVFRHSHASAFVRTHVHKYT